MCAKCYVGLYKDYKGKNILDIFLNLVSKLPEDGTVVPKHFRMTKISSVVYALCAFGWFSEKLGD